MLQQHRFVNGSTSIRKQQTAVKQTIERPKTKSWSNPLQSHRSHPYSVTPASNPDEHDWFKSSHQIFDETPELELSCQEEPLTEAQLKHFPTQAYDPTAPLPTPAVRKRTTVMKKMPPQDPDILQDPDEDFVPSESDNDDDDDDDENYLPEHDRRPYHRTSHVNGTATRGRGRGGRTHLTSNTTTRLAPSTHFVRPQPTSNLHARSQSYSTATSRHRLNDSFGLELERTYANALTRFYGTRNGQPNNSNDYRDFRIKCSICGEQSSNNMSFVAHLCSHFEDDLNYVSPFDKHFRRCSVCHDEFSTPFQTFLHQDQRHMFDLGEYPCRICQEHFGSLVDLFTHLNNVHPSIDMPYHCDRCFYRTSMYEDMAHHIRQMHQGTQYFFCPYCFQSVLLPSIPYTNLLNSTPAYRHVIQHFDRIENFNKQQRRIESSFKYCHRCVLHVKSLTEHHQLHHSITNSKSADDDHRSLESNKRNPYRTDLSVYPSKQLPMATIRRRSTMNSPYEQVYENNRWYSRR